MEILQTYFVYGVLTLWMLLFAYIGRIKHKYSYMFIAILGYAVIFGMRYGVGVDYFSYLSIFERYGYNEWGGNYGETGFWMLVRFLRNLGFSKYFPFFVFAFLQMLFLSLSVRKEYRIYPALVFVVMMGGYWVSYSNGLRQVLALMIFMYSINSIKQKKPWKYCGLILLATLFHKSAVILLPIYPILNYKHDWFTDIKLQYFCLSVSVLLMFVPIITKFLGFFDQVIVGLGYGNYIEDMTFNGQISRDVHIGVGYAIMLFCNIIAIYYSNNIKAYFKDSILPYIYDFYFVGVLLNYAFVKSLLIGRINMYFYGFSVLVIAFTIAYLRKRNRIVYFVLLFCLFLIFIGSTYKGGNTTFIFNWQEDLFYLKIR